MSQSLEMADWIKTLPTATSLSGLSTMLADGSGALLKISATSFLPIFTWSQLLSEISGSCLTVLSPDIEDFPFDSNGTICFTAHHSGNYAFQIGMSILKARIVYRVKSAGIWSSWFQLGFTAV